MSVPSSYRWCWYLSSHCPQSLTQTWFGLHNALEIISSVRLASWFIHSFIPSPCLGSKFKISSSVDNAIHKTNESTGSKGQALKMICCNFTKSWICNIYTFSCAIMHKPIYILFCFLAKIFQCSAPDIYKFISGPFLIRSGFHLVHILWFSVFSILCVVCRPTAHADTNQTCLVLSFPSTQFFLFRNC